jgi:hypothetical protein
LCKEDGPEEYGLIYEKERHIRFQSIEKPFEKAGALNPKDMAESLFHNISSEDLHSLIEHTFCRDRYSFRPKMHVAISNPNENLQDPYKLSGVLRYSHPSMEQRTKPTTTKQPNQQRTNQTNQQPTTKQPTKQPTTSTITWLA